MVAEIDHLKTVVKTKRGFFKYNIDRIPSSDVKDEERTIDIQEK